MVEARKRTDDSCLIVSGAGDVVRGWEVEGEEVEGEESAGGEISFCFGVGFK